MLKILVLLLVPVFSANANVLDDAKNIEATSAAATTTDSATAARTLTGCGFDYQCDANGNRIYDTGTAQEKPVLEPIPPMDLGAAKDIEPTDKKTLVSEPEKSEPATEKTEVKQGQLRGFTGHAKPNKNKPTKNKPSMNILYAADPFAADASLDKAYVSPAASDSSGFVAYGGTSEETLMATAAANKTAARIEQERQAAAESDAELNMMLGAITNAVVNAAVYNATTKQPTKTVTQSVNQPTVYYHRNSAAEAAEASYYQQKKSSILEGAKGMTDGTSKGWY